MPGSDKKSSDDQPKAGKLITLPKAAEISGLTRQHLSLLIRKGELWGTKMGSRDWFTTEKAVRKYMARSLRLGPRHKNVPDPQLISCHPVRLKFAPFPFVITPSMRWSPAVPSSYPAIPRVLIRRKKWALWGSKGSTG